MGKFICHSHVSEAQVIEVIAIESTVGTGTSDDPIRVIREYFAKDGQLLARASSAEDLKQGYWKGGEE